VHQHSFKANNCQYTSTVLSKTKHKRQLIIGSNSSISPVSKTKHKRQLIIGSISSFSSVTKTRLEQDHVGAKDAAYAASSAHSYCAATQLKQIPDATLQDIPVSFAFSTQDLTVCV